jgi:hypothetical protein
MNTTPGHDTVFEVASQKHFTSSFQFTENIGFSNLEPLSLSPSNGFGIQLDNRNG